MKRRIAFIVSVIALVFVGTVIAPPPTYALEEGHHLHFGITNLPTTAARSNYTFHLVLQRHLQDTSAAWIRVADYSTVKDSIVNGRRAQTHTVAVPANGSLAVDMTVPFGEWTCGRHELRFTLNVNDNFEGNRQFTTSRTFITLAGCTTDRSGRPVRLVRRRRRLVRGRGVRRRHPADAVLGHQVRRIDPLAAGQPSLEGLPVQEPQRPRWEHGHADRLVLVRDRHGHAHPADASPLGIG